MNLPWSQPPKAEPLPPPSPPDEEMICYCFHVPRHKIENFIRRDRPEKVSMISYCLGAGTGCGTCVPDIKLIYKQVMAEIAQKEGTSPAPAPAPVPAPAAPASEPSHQSPAPAVPPADALPAPDSSFVVHHSSLSSPPVRLAPIFTAVPITLTPAPTPTAQPPAAPDTSGQAPSKSTPEDRP